MERQHQFTLFVTVIGDGFDERHFREAALSALSLMVDEGEAVPFDAGAEVVSFTINHDSEK